MKREVGRRADEKPEGGAARASAAAEALRRGEVILLYDFDDRERETDLVIAAEFVTPEVVWQLRRDAGGLVCVAIDPLASSKLGLPYIADVLKFAAGLAKTDGVGSGGKDGTKPEGLGAIESLCEREGDIPYDSKSSFSLWVNHRETFTGITDKDRALTIRRISEVARAAVNGGGSVDFGAEFRSPGHVPLLRAAPALLEERRGQTELSIVLARAAKVAPAAVVCEMLDGRTGLSLSKEEAMVYARKRDLAFVEGEDVLELYEERGG